MEVKMIIKIKDGNNELIRLNKNDKFIFAKPIYSNNGVIDDFLIKGNLTTLEQMTFVAGMLTNIYKDVKDMNIMNEIWLTFQKYKDME